MERFKFISAVHLFLIKDKKILMLRRFNTGFEDGNYSLVAGHLDGNESVYDGMRREAKEEADIDIEKEDLKVVHVMHRKSTADGSERIDFFVECKKWSGKIKIMEEDKCDDLSWFRLSKLPENTIPYIRFALENYENGVFFSEMNL